LPRFAIAVGIRARLSQGGAHKTKSFTKMLEKIIADLIAGAFKNLPSLVIVLIYVYFFVIRDMHKRFDGLSAYIRKALTLQRMATKAEKDLVDVLGKLARIIDGKKLPPM
jgi:hypothetical protein